MNDLSLIPATKLADLRQRLKACLSLPGEVAECGVYRGGSALVLAEEMRDSGKSLYLLDTFTGMPALISPVDGHRAGEFKSDLVAVQGLFQPLPFVKVLPGLFSASFPSMEQERFCFVHVDADIYVSVKECCEFFYDRLVPGGVMVFDDYTSPSCQGCTVAVDEFFKGKPEKIEDTGHGSVFVEKGKVAVKG